VEGVPDGTYREARRTGGNEDIEIISDELIVRDGRLGESVQMKARWRNPNDMKAFFANDLRPITNKFKKKVIDVYLKGDRFMPYTVKESGEKFPSLMTGEQIKGINSKGSIEANNLMGFSAFEYPKNTTMLKYLLSYAHAQKDSSDIILDFFAGSATTAHAVMALNAQDNGNRRFIMVQLPEPTPEGSEARKAGFKTIADISRKRIVLAGEKIKQEAGLMAEQLDVGFRAYKLADTNFSKWRVSGDVEPDKLQLHLEGMRDSANDSATQDDLLTEVLLKLGFSLTARIVTKTIDGLEVREVGDNLLLAYLDEGTKPTLEQLRALVDAGPVRLVVLEDAFQGDDELKTNLHQYAKGQGVELWTA
jgi:adenine-specific DNA-methyltransferase